MTKKQLHRLRCSWLNAADVIRANQEALAEKRRLLQEADFHLAHAKLINDSVLGFLYTKPRAGDEWGGSL